MIFIDGTNLFERFRSAKLSVPRLLPLLEPLVRPRKLVRPYLYTSSHRLSQAEEYHGLDWLEGVHVVLGDSVQTGDGSFKEKAVDALLVADLIYHAAQRNYEYAVVVTHDTDYRYAIKRVGDFGCRTSVAAFCVDAPDRLKTACDEYQYVDEAEVERQVLGLT